ncbi:hypothetical protein FHT92_005925 [Rhizobium sp. BK377]|nr:hypothetical protein [Rhizobium sp. BK377]
MAVAELLNWRIFERRWQTCEIYLTDPSLALHPLPLFEGRLDSGVIPLDRLLEGFDFLADLSINLAADRNCCIEMADLPGLAVKPCMNDRSAFASVLLLLLEILPDALHAFFDAAERVKDIFV